MRGAVLMIVLPVVWASASAVAALTSMGHASSWLLVGGPLVVTAWVIKSLWWVLRDRPARRSWRLPEPARDAAALFLPACCVTLLMASAVPVGPEPVRAALALVAAALVVAILTFAGSRHPASR